MSFASFWGSLHCTVLFGLVLSSILAQGTAYDSVLGLAIFLSVINGVFCFFAPMEEIKHQKPENMMIGMLGASFWLTVFFIGGVLFRYDLVISWTLMLGSCWWYFLSFSIFFCGKETHLEYDTVGVKIKWIRVICSYFATLPLFLFATELLWLNAIFHFSILLFYFEACLIHRSSEFREFLTSEELFSRYYCGKVQISTIRVSEEERKKLAYRILNSVDFFTDFEK